MELDRIEELLKKYFDATTTVAEEDTLRAYFSQEKVAAHLEQYIPMFQYFSNEKKEKFAKRVSLAHETGPFRKKWIAWGSVAAAVTLMFGIYLGKSYQDEKEQERKRAEYAYSETKKALDLLAENFSRGTEKVAYLNEFVEAKQKIYNKN